MEKLKKSRTVLRSSFTKVLNNLNTLLENGFEDLTDIQVAYKVLEIKAEELQNIDKQVYDLLLEDDNFTEEYLLAETSKADEYVFMFETAKIKVQKVSQPNSPLSCNDQIHSETGFNVFKRKFKLPMLELTKFDGCLMNWLPFWSQFSKIHSDDSIVPEDKFQYLFQAVVPGTRAHDVIHSFPPVGENYFKAIDSLKARFGKDDLLVEVYVRELLKIVLQNALGNKNEVSLQSLYDKLESHIRALETLGVTTDKCASILYPLVESCMPEELLRAWQRSSLKTGDNPQDRLNNLMKFMLSEVEGEQRIGLAMSGFGVNVSSRDNKYGKKPSVQVKVDVPTAASLVSSSKYQQLPKCIFCEKGHKSADCFSAQKMTLEEKNKILREKKGCYCCLLPGHSIKHCKSNVKCALCKRRHFLIMCANFPINKQQEIPKAVTDEATKLGSDNVLSNNSLKGSPKVFMQTVVANLRNPKSNVMIPIRVLFDTGSQRSYVLQSLAKEMGYESSGKETIVHSLFGNVKSAEHRHKKYRIYLSNVDSTYKCNFEVLDQPTICGDISHITPGPWLAELSEKHISLTDVEDNNLPISLLIGADVAGKLFTGKREQLESGLVVMETLLGWTMMGKLPDKGSDSYLSTIVTSMLIKEVDVSELWRLESIGIRDSSEQVSSVEQTLCVEKHFLDTTVVNDEGRYEVTLPWIDGHLPLPFNKDIAERRLATCVDKLEKINLFTEYDTVFKQWEQDGIIETVPTNEKDKDSHYLPHRPVVKESSITTRIRPVFDASAKGKYAASLNDCLEKGPNIIELIPSVMLRFREGKFGAVADIAKAFLQISINPKDRDYLRFLWYSNKDRDKIVEYRHRRVVFGVKCSPFLLGATINLHLQNCLLGEKCSIDVINRLKKSFYVDNVSTSVDTELQLQYFMKESIDVMALGQFDLRGWKCSGDVDTDFKTNVLGVQWNYREDVLYLNIECLKDFDLSCITRRTILSIAHRIFDPIGFVCPVMLYPKVLLQKTWSEKGDTWDTEVNEEISNEFKLWFNELSSLEKIQVPRWIGKSVKDNSGCSIHTFCDGSKIAYGTVIFLRVESGLEVKVHLIAARSRVAPMKHTTIPRIELLAALIGARLAHSVLNAMDWKDIPVYYWTDSSTVLAWIKQDKNWSVFVLNRVLEIRKITNVAEWNHIRGKENPADLPSRGCDASQMATSRWWEGPNWMKYSMDMWPMSVDPYNEEEIVKEIRKTDKSNVTNCLVNKQLNNFSQIYSRYFSCYVKMVRVVAWTCRFISNCLTTKNHRLTEVLTNTEINIAEKKLLILVQQETLTDLEENSTLSHFLHEDGLIRLKTKLSKKDDIFDFKFPIVLPAKHNIVLALIKYQHERHCHAGVQILMNILRENYWIIGGRRSIRAVVSKCIVCKRQKVKQMEAIPATLPMDRLRDACIFEVTGTDFTGPVYLKKGEKSWICIFTCAVYRAVHMELVTALSTEAFLQAFRRFIARRGRPSIMYSDNGTNYVGTYNALQQIDWNYIEQYSNVHRIQWKFSPPSAPWWGGWWERIVRLIKELLRRVLGRASLDYQEMLTMLCDCEAVINARPLTYIYDGESDLIPLSPNHFLQEIRECGVPDIDRIEEVNLNKRLKYLQSLRQDLRQRFRKEYLGQLVHRCKSSKKYRNLEVGEVVLLECDNLKRVEWPLALVVEVLPDKDGTVRLARVKTQNRTLLRPVQRLYPLEVTSKEDLLKDSFDKFTNRDKNEMGEVLAKPIVRTRSGRIVNIPKSYKT